MVSLIVLRKKEPELHRPFKVPLYPVSPILALIIAVVSVLAMTYYNWQLALIYFALMIVSFIGYKVFYKNELK